MFHTLQDLYCWQKARDLTLLIYEKTGKLEESYFKEELRSASLIAMNNVAKGTAFCDEDDFCRCYEISISSCFKIENLTYLLEELNEMNPEDINRLREDAADTRKEIISFYEFRTSRQIFKSDDDDEYLPPIIDFDSPK
jgi:four helix bundle protein